MLHRCVGINAPYPGVLKKTLKGGVPSVESCDEWNALYSHVFPRIPSNGKVYLIISSKLVFFLTPILIIVLNAVLDRSVLEQNRLKVEFRGVVAQW